MDVRTLSKFGYREVDMLADLLKEYAAHGCQFLMSGNLQFDYNPNSDTIYLFDNDGNVGLLNEEGKLEQFVTCFECGTENFISHLQLSEDGLCESCAKNLNA